MSLTRTHSIKFRATKFSALLSWRAALAAGLLATTVPMTPYGATAAERGTFSPLCAAHDLKTLDAIERAGELGEIASSRLAEAGLTFLRGRILCLSGEEAQGVATYQGVVSAVTPGEKQVAK